MNAHKAREFFSAHLEGSLDAGLTAAFERALAGDSGLSAEYAEFRATVARLSTIKDEAVPEPPFDLHERISARIDKAVWEAKQAQPTGFWSKWRLPLAGFAATAAVVATVVALQRPAQGPATAGVVEAPIAAPGLEVRLAEGRLWVTHGAKAGTTVEVVRLQDGVKIDAFDVSERALDAPLQNASSGSVLVVIEAAGSSKVLALPGTRRAPKASGEGTVTEFALAIADTSGTPVEVRAKDQALKAPWTFEAADLAGSVQKETGWKIERRADGLLVVSD